MIALVVFILRKQLNIRLEQEIHTHAKVTAILKGRTLNDYIESAIRTALEKDGISLKQDNSKKSKK